MKRTFILICIIFGLAACKKDEVVVPPTVAAPAPQKWQDKYIGNYKGVWSSQEYSPGTQNPINYKDTIINIGADADVNKNTTSLSNCSVIQFNENNECSIYHGIIKYISDSLYYNCANGGIAVGISETFKGKKL